MATLKSSSYWSPTGQKLMSRIGTDIRWASLLSLCYFSFFCAEATVAWKTDISFNCSSFDNADIFCKALSLAVENGRQEAVLKLLQLGADQTLRTKAGKSPADLAVIFKHSQVPGDLLWCVFSYVNHSQLRIWLNNTIKTQLSNLLVSSPCFFPDKQDSGFFIHHLNCSGYQLIGDHPLNVFEDQHWSIIFWGMVRNVYEDWWWLIMRLRDDTIVRHLMVNMLIELINFTFSSTNSVTSLPVVFDWSLNYQRLRI